MCLIVDTSGNGSCFIRSCFDICSHSINVQNDHRAPIGYAPVSKVMNKV